VFPLRCTFERGDVKGVFGWMFDVLMSFDQPYNQAPSLHIALLVVLLEPYLRARPEGVARVGLCCRPADRVSVLTTWQHHFFDIPTGLWLGCFAVWLFPDRRAARRCAAATLTSSERRRLATLAYAAALTTDRLPRALAGGGWLWLLWAAGSLAWSLVIYLLLDAEAFEKRADGSMPRAVRCLLGPYLVAPG
jgi:hypothetical protein